MKLHDRVAVVTGAGGSIGRALAVALARRGCHLALADIDPNGNKAEVAKAYAKVGDTYLQLREPAKAAGAFTKSLDADPDQLDQLLINLVRNAADAALETGGGVRVWWGTEGAGSSATVRVVVEDDGPGTPDESLGDALEPFVRLDSARKLDTVGFGLGLSIVQRAAEAEGGRLELRNRDAGGLCAAIILPAPFGPRQ